MIYEFDNSSDFAMRHANKTVALCSRRIVQV